VARKARPPIRTRDDERGVTASIRCPVCEERELHKLTEEFVLCLECSSVLSARGILLWGERRIEQRRQKAADEDEDSK